MYYYIHALQVTKGKGKKKKKKKYHNTSHPHTPQPHNKQHIILTRCSNIPHSSHPRLIAAPHRRKRRQIARIPEDVFDVDEAGLVHDAELGVARLAEEGTPDAFFRVLSCCCRPRQETALLAGAIEQVEVGAVGGVLAAALRAGTA